MVECSFNMMNDIIDSRSSRIEIEPYTAIMTTRYNLKSSKSAEKLKLKVSSIEIQPKRYIARPCRFNTFILYAYIFITLQKMFENKARQNAVGEKNLL